MKITVEGFSFPSEVGVGQYSARGGDGPFPAWCAETTQFLRFGEVIEYNHVDGLSAWSAPISLSLDQLMSWAASEGWPSNATESEAIQRDIWAILAGYQGAIDVGHPALTMRASLLHSDSRQDLLVSRVVSEPDPAAILLIGCLLLAGFRMLRT